MKKWRRGSWIPIVGVLVLLSAAGVVHGQTSTGNLYGRVIDDHGNRLPGVTVTLDGPGAEQVQVTNAEGEFRFLGLAPGNYKLTAELEGFSTVVYEAVNIRIGRNTTVEIALSPAVEETITITTESPLLDQRKLTTGTTVTDRELEQIPTARDPWALLHQAPAVQVDRINVGGNESGQQALFVRAGAASAENAFAVDGVVITDMSAAGASPGYYDFASFQEVQLATGGTDASLATGGVTVNLVTRRGTDTWRGSGRYLLADSGLQSSSGFDEDDLAPGQDPADFRPDEIDRVTDAGVELGGRLIEDRLWFWGAYAEQEIANLVTGGTRDETSLENVNAKLNGQLSDANSATFLYSWGDKVVDGRGAGPQRAPETTWDQTGPVEIWKLEDSHVFSSDFYLTGLWSTVDGGLELVPQGGLEEQALLGADGVFRRTLAEVTSDRDVDQWRLDASYFWNAGATSHELEVGVGLREADSTDGTKWGGGVLVFEQPPQAGGGPGGVNVAQVFRGEVPSTAFTSRYRSAWVQDTLTRDRLTVNLGLRYDLQDGENPSFSLAGSPLLPDLLPDLDFQGNDAAGLEFEEISPRLGVTYALGDKGRTLLRASYSRFSQQLQQDLVERLNPLAPASALIAFFDFDADLEFDPEELLALLGTDGFDPADPTALESPNRNAADLDAELTDEVVLGVEHAFRPGMVAGLHLTWRRVSEIHERAYLVRDPSTGAVFAAGPEHFVPQPALPPGVEGEVRDGQAVATGTLPGGGSYEVPLWTLDPDLQLTGGQLLRNGDREQEYLGVTLDFTKSLSNRWLFRGHVTVYDWEWQVPSSYFYDANDLAPGRRPETATDGGQDFDDDGAPVAELSAGDKADVLLNSRWSFNLNALYQVAPERPWGFDVAASVRGREGYPVPYYLLDVLGADGLQRDVQVSPTGGRRNPDLYVVDARIDKDFTFGDLGVTLSVDAFNLFNEGTVLQRERNLAGGQPNFVDEVLSPRVFRLGVRLSWK